MALASAVNREMGDTREIACGLRDRDVAVLQMLVESIRTGWCGIWCMCWGVEMGVDDLVQETWLRVMERGKSYDGRSRFEPWLFTVARHLAIDFLRRRREVSLDAEDDGRPVMVAPVSQTMSPFALAARTEEAEWLAGGVAIVAGGFIARRWCCGLWRSCRCRRLRWWCMRRCLRWRRGFIEGWRRCGRRWRRSMGAERHLDFEQRIDRSLAGAGTPEEERALEEHVRSCAACGEYLSASRRAVAGVKGILV